MFGQVGDALGKKRDLHFGRTSVAGLCRVFLDEFRLAFDRDRHRVILSLYGRANRCAGSCSAARGRDVVQPGPMKNGRAFLPA
jgi:hypothetical protein